MKIFNIIELNYKSDDGVVWHNLLVNGRLELGGIDFNQARKFVKVWGEDGDIVNENYNNGRIYRYIYPEREEV